jgi:hypothetical protein
MQLAKYLILIRKTKISTFHTDDGEKLELVGVITWMCHATVTTDGTVAYTMYCIWRLSATIFDIFVNCNWVDTRRQYTFTHKQYTEHHN